MKRKVVIPWISALLTLLWVYAATSKLVHYNSFLIQLDRQPIPEWSIGILAIGLPVFELIIALLLCSSWTRKAGLWFSFLLMTCFTLYVGLALAGAFKDLPCSCGGILNSMGWKTHLIFNIVWLLLAFAGVALSNRKFLNIQIRMQGAPE